MSKFKQFLVFLKNLLTPLTIAASVKYNIKNVDKLTPLQKDALKKALNK